MEQGYEMKTNGILLEVQKGIDDTPSSVRGGYSDGYHTFGELYAHRIALFIALCKMIDHREIMVDHVRTVWKSSLHSDGTAWDGWFILGIGKAKGHQITYHLPMSEWENCKVIDEVERAPEWDGHSSADVLDRLKSFF